MVAIAVLAFAADYAACRFSIPRGREVFGSVTVREYYAVAKKNGKTEFMFNPPQTQSCLRSMFPHFGYTPCWYLQRHREQRIEI